MYKSLKGGLGFLLSVAAVALLALLTTGALWAQETQEEPPPQPEADAELPVFPLLESKAFARADFDKLAEEAAAFIKAHPDSPQAELLMEFLSSFRGRITNYDIFEPVLEQILEKKLENGFNEELYRRTLARFYRRRGLEQKALSTHSFDGYILDCLILGPFGNSYRASMDEVYGPEKDLLEGLLWPDLVKKEYVGSDEFRKIAWIKYHYEKPVRSPYVSPSTYLRPSGGCAYALIQVKLPEERPVLLDISAGSLFKVWVNKTLLLRVNSDEKRAPDSHLVPVKLVEGYNQILIKLPSGSFALALRDTNGHLLRGLERETGLQIHAVEAKGSPVYSGDYNGGALKWARGLSAEKSDDPIARVACSFMLAEHGMSVEALEEAQEALRLAPENLFVAYCASIRYMDAPHIPRALARNRAKELWDRIIKADPGFVLAYERIADYLTNDDKHEKAIELLGEKVIAQGLGNLGTHKALLGIYSSRKWEREVIEQIRAIEKLAPQSDSLREWLYDWWARWYAGHGNPEKAWEYTTRSYELDKSGTWYLSRRAARLEARGRLDEALEVYLEIIKREPENYWALRNIAEVYRRQGKYAEAIAQHRKLMEFRPENSSNYETIGNIYREWGKEPEAISWYNKTLVLEQGSWSLRRYVQHLTGVDEDFYKPYALTDEEVMELVKSAPGKETFPKAANLKVLDEEITKILPDGSKSTYVHMVYKLLDISGKDRHASPYLRGEPIEVRTILPDGTILEPISMHGSYTMPGLKEGVCIEHKCRADSGWGRSRRADYETEHWYFQDEGLDEPIMKCRRVVIMPKKPALQETVELLAQFGRQPWSVLDFCDFKQNMVGAGAAPEGAGEIVSPVKFTREDKGDVIVFTWTSENTPRIEYEPYMPAVKHVLPNAYFVSRRSWEDFEESLNESTFTSSDILPTKLVREKAREIVAGTTGQYGRVKALYEWCMNEIKTGWSGGAHAILLEKSGSRDTLFMSFLKALDIPFDIVLVGPDPFANPDIEWEIPRASYFGSEIMRVKPDDHEPLCVSLSTRYLPLGKISERLQGGPLYTPEEGITGKSLPRELLDDKADKEFFSINLESLTCGATLLYPGYYSYGQKESYKDMPVAECKQRIERRANSYFPGAVLLSKPELPGLKEVGRMFEIRFTCKAPNFLTVKKDGSIAAKTGTQPLEMQRRYIEKTTREFDMVLSSENLARTRVTIELGDRYELVQLPTSLNIRNEFGTYVLTFSQEGSRLTVKRRFTLLPQRIKKDRYEDFIEFCKKIDEAEVARIILREKVKETPEPQQPEEKSPEEKGPGEK